MLIMLVKTNNVEKFILKEAGAAMLLLAYKNHCLPFRFYKQHD